MLRSTSCGFIRNIVKHLRKNHCMSATVYHPKSVLSMGSKILIGSQICCAALKNEDQSKIDVENSLSKACEEGDTAILLLLDTLKDFVIVVCREYRSCLTKQIEITETASKIGPFSEVWDELPQYRTLAAELHKELDDYMAIFNTIGQMTSEDTLVSFVTGTTDKMNLVAVKYKELDVLLQKEFAQNKEIESKLLRIKCDSIISSVN